MRKSLRRVAMFSVVCLIAGLLGLTGVTPASAVSQVGGHDLSGWATGWNWRYNRQFHVTDTSGDDVTVNESVLYTNAGVTTWAGQLAYKLNLTGTVTGGSGTGAGVSLSSFAGSVTGEQYVRVSDLATIRDHEVQNFTAKAAGLVTVTAAVETAIDSAPAERGTLFRLHSGDTWSFNVAQTTTGAFNYDAGSFGSGASPLDSTGNFTGNATVTSTTISPPIAANLPVDFVHNVNADASTIDDQYWSPTYDNLAQQHSYSLGSDGSTLTLDRQLTAASTPAPAAALTENLSSNLSCAGAPITVSGVLSTGAAGQTVNVLLDESAVSPGSGPSVSTTTGAGGAYSAVVTAPAVADGAAKDGARGSWGIVVQTSNAVQAATLVVTAQDCTTLGYTGATSAQLGASPTLSAVLVDQGTGLPLAGQPVLFSLSGQAGTVSATTNASGVATTNTLAVTGAARSATVTASFAATTALTAASTSSPFTVTVDPTATTVTSSEPSATIGDPVTFSAFVAPVGASLAIVPTGTVQFKVDGSPLGSPVALDGTASASSIPINSLSIGTHPVVAVYSGDANYGPSTSVVFNQVVHKVLTATAVAVTTSQNPTVFGQATTLTAAITASDGGTPTGGITFKDGATTIGTATLDEVPGTDTAVLTLSTLAVGVHHITAVYGADDDFAPGTSPAIDQTVLKAQTTVSVVPSDASPVSGEALSFTINVNPVAPGDGTPTGTVQLVVDGGNVGSPVNVAGGVAAVNVASLPAGAHTVAAVYSGDGSFVGNTGSIPLSVAKADTSTSLTIQPNPSVDGQAVTLTATVVPVAPGAGSPTGLVTFKEGTTVLGAASLATTTSGQQATIGLSNLSVGDHVITATYGGDGNDNSSTSDPVTQTVINAPPIISTTMALAASANPSAYGQPVTYTATVTAADSTTPTGTVQFSVDGTDLGGPVPLTGGVATSPAIASLTAGGHTVVASYSGDLGYSESSQVRSQSVKQAVTSGSIASSANPADYAQAVSFTATLSAVAPGAGTPGGSVQFMLDGNPLGTPVAAVGGQATSPTVAVLDPGHHTISIVTTGDPNFKATTTAYDELVNRIPTATALAAAPNPALYGQAVTLTATVTASGPGTPSGSVTFRDGTTVLGTGTVATVGSSQQAQLVTSALGAGNHVITATYDGDVRFLPSGASNSVTEAVGQSATVLAATPAVLQVKITSTGLLLNTTISLLAPLTATLTSAAGVPIAGQTVTFTVGITTLCTSTTNSAGVATCAENQVLAPSLVQLVLGLGYHANFGGSANYLPSTGTAGLIKLT